MDVVSIPSVPCGYSAAVRLLIFSATERTPVSKHAILWLFTSQSIMVHKPSVAVHSSHATSTTVKSIVKDRQSNLVVHRTCKHQVSSTWIELLM
ncbi:hypothetical protein ABBQ38_006224 [Trebouxia sp. C0009 RCD-2024]